MPKRHPAIVLIAALAIALAVAPAAAQQQAGEEATVVGTDAVAVKPLEQTVPVLGRLVAARAGVVATRIGGPVGEFRVRVGDRVEAGTVVALLVKDRLEQQVALQRAEAAQTRAAIKTAQTQVALREQELQRLERLRRSAAFSQARYEDKKAELQQAESAVVEARATLQRAEASLRLAEIDLANAEIRAPYAGVVSERHTEVGAYVSPGAPMVSLIDDKNLEIEADVPAERIGGLAPGTTIAFNLADGAGGTATVRAVVPDENPLTRTRSVRFTPAFEKRPALLATNQSVTLEIPAGRSRDVVTVHKDAVLHRNDRDIVYVVADGVANVRPVELGEAVGERFEVIAGLRPGDRVVVRGNERLRPGQTVKTQP